MKESDKYAAAKTWEASIQIVKVEWLLECLKRWEKVDEKDYRLVDGTGDEEDNISTGDEEDEIETADEEENENKDEDEKMEVEEEKEKKESNVDGSESRSESVELEGDQPTMQEMDAMRALFDDQPFDQIEPPQKRSLHQSPPKAKRIEKEEEEKEEREMEREVKEKEREVKEKEREERENDHEKKESESESKSQSDLDSKPNQELQSQSQSQSQSDSISESKSEVNPDPQSASLSNPPTDKPRYFLYSGGTLDPDLRDAILRLGGNYIETQYVSPFPHFP